MHIVQYNCQLISSQEESEPDLLQGENDMIDSLREVCLCKSVAHVDPNLL